MLGSGILEMGIGLIFLFGLLSLLVSAFQEMLEGLLKRRAINLERGIKRLLASVSQDESGTRFNVEDLYETTLISSLFDGEYGADWLSRRKLPSHIPPETFAKALNSLLANRPGARQALVSRLAPDTAELSAEAISAKATREIEALYTNMTDSLTALYRRRTQRVLFFIGFVVAVLLNFNTIVVAEGLYKSPALRATILAEVEAAEAGAEGFASLAGCADIVSAEERKECLSDRLQSFDLPIGWGGDTDESTFAQIQDEVADWTLRKWLASLVGWTFSAFAICLGAGFWFDLLGKAVNLRSTLRPKMPAS